MRPLPGVPEANMDIPNYRWNEYMRLLLWIFAEAIVGVLFYELFTYMSDFAKIITYVSAIAIIWYDYDYLGRTGKRYAAPLFVTPIVLALACGVAWKITGDDIWGRLCMACVCVRAAYTVIDRMVGLGF